VVFVELTPFAAFRSEYWTDEDLRALLKIVASNPQAAIEALHA
jgi:hypothetical protein